jgi:hypothetical protein
MIPPIYDKSSSVELRLHATDSEGNVITPADARISILLPDGTTTVVEYEDLTPEDTDLIYDFIPDQTGWFEYEGWIKDDAGRESTQTKGFTVTDYVG